MAGDWFLKWEASSLLETQGLPSLRRESKQGQDKVNSLCTHMLGPCRNIVCGVFILQMTESETTQDALLSEEMGNLFQLLISHEVAAVFIFHLGLSMNIWAWLLSRVLVVSKGALETMKWKQNNLYKLRAKPTIVAKNRQFSLCWFFFFLSLSSFFFIDKALLSLISEGHVYPTLFFAASLLLVTNCESHVLFEWNNGI